MMGKRIIFIVVIWMALATLALGANKRFTLVIDAGHGGRDAGCVGATGMPNSTFISVLFPAPFSPRRA